MFDHIPAYPGDPILSLNEDFQLDPRPNKVNLSIGIYFDDAGKLPVMDAVRHAETALLGAIGPRSYLPMAGLPLYRDAAQALVFGANHEARAAGRIATLQTIGGSGALKVGADFLKRYFPASQIWISDPSWENHRVVFENAGLTVNTYPYYDEHTGGLRFADMIETIGRLPEQSIVLLHACCHNPTGVDLKDEQWQRVIEVVNRRGLVPFLDLAYQGFADGLDADASAVRRFSAACPTVVVSSSFSKSLSLYGERVGACHIITQSAEEASRVLSQVKRVIRTNYSSPPTSGGQMVTTVLTTPELRTLWERELGEMRDRIKTMRRQLVDKIRAIRADFDFSFVVEQRGMFSYSGLTREQVQRLRDEYSVYTIDSGRICVAALTTRNVDYVAKAVASVLV